MKDVSPYLISLWWFIPLLFFTIAVIFRLLDNSTYLFLKRDILINSSNVSRKILKKQIKLNSDPVFTRQLKRALVFRNLQQSFMISAAVSFPVSLLYYLLT